MTPNIHYENREIIGERLELKKGPIYWLGPELTLCDCTVIISAAGHSLVPMSGQLINCTIQAKGQLKAVVWAQLTLKGCPDSRAALRATSSGSARVWSTRGGGGREE